MPENYKPSQINNQCKEENQDALYQDSNYCDRQDYIENGVGYIEVAIARIINTIDFNPCLAPVFGAKETPDGYDIEIIGYIGIGPYKDFRNYTYVSLLEIIYCVDDDAEMGTEPLYVSEIPIGLWHPIPYSGETPENLPWKNYKIKPGKLLPEYENDYKYPGSALPLLGPRFLPQSPAELEKKYDLGIYTYDTDDILSLKEAKELGSLELLKLPKTSLTPEFLEYMIPYVGDDYTTDITADEETRICSHPIYPALYHWLKNRSEQISKLNLKDYCGEEGYMTIYQWDCIEVETKKEIPRKEIPWIRAPLNDDPFEEEVDPSGEIRA